MGSSLPSLDTTYGFHICLYALSLECILFMAVVSESRSQDPYSHGGIAQTFSILFFLQSAIAFCSVTSLQVYPGFLSEILATASQVFIAGAALIAIPAAALITVPEVTLRVWKTLMTTFNVVVLAVAVLWLGPHLHLGLDLPVVPMKLQSYAVGALFGTLAVVLFAAVIRLLRPPESLKGRSGAAVLASGASLMLVGGFSWALMKERCRFTEGKIDAACVMPQGFDHNALWVLFVIIANGFVAEGVLRIMAAGTGAENYVQI